MLASLTISNRLFESAAFLGSGQNLFMRKTPSVEITAKVRLTLRNLTAAT